jgi:hypothetical protein
VIAKVGPLPHNLRWRVNDPMQEWMWSLRKIALSSGISGGTILCPSRSRILMPRARMSWYCLACSKAIVTIIDLVQEVNIDIEYITTSEPSVVRALRLTRAVPTSLPIAVNVQDFFRGTRCSRMNCSLFRLAQWDLQAVF